MDFPCRLSGPCYHLQLMRVTALEQPSAEHEACCCLCPDTSGGSRVRSGPGSVRGRAAEVLGLLCWHKGPSPGPTGTAGVEIASPWSVLLRMCMATGSRGQLWCRGWLLGAGAAPAVHGRSYLGCRGDRSGCAQSHCSESAGRHFQDVVGAAGNSS